MAAEMVMLNVRMERGLRERGNEVLAELGVTPSEYVRAIWERLAGDRQEAKALVERAMTPVRTTEKQAEIDRRVEAAERGSRLYLDFAERYGLDLSTYVPMTDEELEKARYEYLNEKYGV